MSFDDDKPHHRTLRQLLAKQNKYPSLDRSPLVAAAQSGELNTVKSLIESGQCNINETIDKGRVNALMIAIHKHNNDIVRYLLNMGADYDYINQPPYCDTALHWAAYYRNPQATKMLLEKNAVWDIVNHSGVTPLMDAQNHCKESQALIESYSKLSAAARARIVKFQHAMKNNPNIDLIIITNDLCDYAADKD
ncbi:hypothetical protein C9374_003705 [Naegleria lovaniensis]|uniref:Ankyrin repeat protein n=1 Tax=Naegleria lovaniensis TaxID=51637 RepID=A0AA88H7Y3_NAELO|nr:uncharacterized protein C9374_003705 [Naegleria lovaniensis]KAG2393941.1 hypothetical protein C9374_003705 [Naegleria lovaniensis]